MIDREKILRAQGCLVGQLAGDSLGSLVEFMTPEKITELYPDGVRHMIDGGVNLMKMPLTPDRGVFGQPMF